MALTDDNNGGIPATMLVAPTGAGTPYPVYMNQGGGSGNNGGWDNGNGWWIILLFILLASGNWGGNYGGNSGGGFGGSPIIVNDSNGSSVQRGFDQAAIMGGLNGIQSGVQGLSTQLCNCCCDMQQTVSNGFAQAEIADNARQMANMNQIYGLSSQFADCCCENRLATADLKYTIATENCADRYEAAQNTRDIIDSQTRSTQSILDKLCQLELDAKNDKINDLERQLTMANLSASQIAQTAEIARGQVAEVDALYQRLRDCPVPTQPVYGSQPIFTCPQNNNCGCGCGGNNF